MDYARAIPYLYENLDELMSERQELIDSGWTIEKFDDMTELELASREGEDRDTALSLAEKLANKYPEDSDSIEAEVRPIRYGFE